MEVQASDESLSLILNGCNVVSKERYAEDRFSWLRRYLLYSSEQEYKMLSNFIRSFTAGVCSDFANFQFSLHDDGRRAKLKVRVFSVKLYFFVHSGPLGEQMEKDIEIIEQYLPATV